jgi:hypothetical protein
MPILSCSTSRKEWAVAGERAEIVRHEDNLHPEGSFQLPEPQVITLEDIFYPEREFSGKRSRRDIFPSRKSSGYLNLR